MACKKGVAKKRGERGGERRGKEEKIQIGSRTRLEIYSDFMKPFLLASQSYIFGGAIVKVNGK
jgi:hypothetical protein